MLSPAACQRAFSARKNKQSLFLDSALSHNMNYMNVIRESHASIIRRKELEQQKRYIMNMEFETAKDKSEWQNLNKFLSERQSDRMTALSNAETRTSPTEPMIHMRSSKDAPMGQVQFTSTPTSPNGEAVNNVQAFPTQKEPTIGETEEGESTNLFIKNDNGDGESGTEVVKR